MSRHIIIALCALGLSACATTLRSDSEDQQDLKAMKNFRHIEDRPDSSREELKRLMRIASERCREQGFRMRSYKRLYCEHAQRLDALYKKSDIKRNALIERYEALLPKYPKLKLDRPMRRVGSHDLWRVVVEMESAERARMMEAELNSPVHLLSVICDAKGMISKSNTAISREKRIAKASGSVNLSALNDWGRIKIASEDSFEVSSKKYRAQTGKAPNLSKCKNGE